jgi:thioredoxin-related protein
MRTIYMKCILFISIFVPTIIFGATDTGGIKFVNNKSWAQVKAQAKSEMKYIFVDCFATWCGPCKAMDKDVYPDKRLGQLFKDKYIAVKIQMDETKNDNSFVRAWRGDARNLVTQYKVAAYPTFLFFNPQGDLVMKDQGYKGPDSLFAIASAALQAGLSYEDPFEEYDKLVNDFRAGNFDFLKIDYVVSTARSINDSKLADSLCDAFRMKIGSLSPDEVFNKAYIDFIAKELKTSRDPLFELFYQQGMKVDRLMGQVRYACQVVDKMISLEETSTALARAARSKSHVNWDSLFRVIEQKYTADHAERGIMAAKLRWYQYNLEWDHYDTLFVHLVEKYGIESLDIYRNLYVRRQEEKWFAIDLTLNWFCWERVFERKHSDQMLDFAIRYMAQVVERSEKMKSSYWSHATRDTYANLLYKKGYKEEAIRIENEAIWYATNGSTEREYIEAYESNLKRMKQNLPTWK